MLDRLPPELLLPILRLVAPLDVGGNWTDTAYKQRRSVLRSLCLVNKQLCALAQPMLQEQFEVKDDKEAVEVLRTERDGCTLGGTVKLLLVRAQGEELPVVQPKRFVDCCPAAADVRIWYCTSLSLDIFAPLTDYIVSPTLDPALVARLHILMTFSDDPSYGPTAYSQFADKLGSSITLQRFTSLDEAGRLHGLDFTHLRIGGLTMLYNPFFSGIIRCLDACPPALKTIQLPSFAEPVRVTDPILKSAGRRFTEMCERRGVDILWSELVSLDFNSLVSPELAEWAAKEYERKAVGVASSGLARISIDG
ncbi:hypothetical protein JCM8097_004039 [Rhodosporidiobolus ruineniae]